MINPLKKKTINFMNESELEELRVNIESRRKEAVLRKQQDNIETYFKENGKGKGFNFDVNKIKRGAIIVVVAIVSAIIVHRLLLKFGIL